MSEWQIDKYGRRYRMIGNIQEFETMVKIDGLEIPQSEVEAYNRRRKEREEQERAAALEKMRNAPPARDCPFGSGGMAHSCRREQCGVFDGEACGLSHLAPAAPADTKGKKCPFNPYPCRERCTLYKNGCILTAIKERKQENE